MAPTKAQYAKINIACKELGIDKYQLLADRYGVASSKELNRFQTEDLLAHFKKLGWKVKRGKKTAYARYEEPEQRKVQALWITLAKAGKLRNRSDKAMQAYVKRMTGKDHLKWCDRADCFALIESLKSWTKREGVDAY